MENMEINISEIVTDKQIAKFGMTREQFEKSEVKNLLEAMLYSTEKNIQEETQRLMKECSLSYGEARGIATKKVREAIIEGMEKDKMEASDND